MHKIKPHKLRSSGSPDLSSSSKTRAKRTTYETLIGWVPSSAVCHLEASVGSTAPVKESRVLNDLKI